MKKKLIRIIVPITIFIIINFFYAISAMNVNKPNLFGQIATHVTIIITYPYVLFIKSTNINPNGWLLELNFILLSLALTYLIFKVSNIKK